MALLTAKAIANESLVQLMINLAATSVFYRGLEPELAGTPRTGGTIAIRRPAVFTAQEFETDIVEQSADEGSVDLTIEKMFDVSVPITSKELTFSLVDFTTQIITPAMISIAEKFERYILSKTVQVAQVVGQVSNPIDTLPELMNVGATLTNWKIPLANRVGVIGPFQAASIKGNADLIRADARADQGVGIREAYLGRTAGINWFESQATYKHVAGTLSNGSAKTAKANATAQGATTMTLTDTTLTGTVVAGDVFSIAGMVDEEGIPFYSRVTTAATASGNSIAITFEPALPAAVSLNAVVTFLPTHKAGLVGNPNGLAWACVPPALPMGTEKSAVATYKGLGIRVTMGYNQQKKKDVISFDTFAAASVIDPRLLARYL